jgi:hypothetical protein
MDANLSFGVMEAVLGQRTELERLNGTVTQIQGLLLKVDTAVTCEFSKLRCFRH